MIREGNEIFAFVILAINMSICLKNGHRILFSYFQSGLVPGILSFVLAIVLQKY